MAIKPIDMHVLLPKLHKNDQMKAHILHRQENEQHMMASVNKQDVQAKLNKVNDFEQKESPRVRDDGHRGSDREASEKKKEKESPDPAQKESETTGSPIKRNHIDIKV